MLETKPATTDTNAPCSVERIEEIWNGDHAVSVSINGSPPWIIRDTDTLHALLQLVDRLESIEKIRVGLESVERGHTLPLDDVFLKLRTNGI